MSSPSQQPVLVAAGTRWAGHAVRISGALRDVGVETVLAEPEAVTHGAVLGLDGFGLVVVLWSSPDPEDLPDTGLEGLAQQADLEHKLVLVTIAGERAPRLGVKPELTLPEWNGDPDDRRFHVMVDEILTRLTRTTKPNVQQPAAPAPRRSTAKPQAADPQTAGPQTAEPQTAQPRTPDPHTAEPQTPQPQTPQPQTPQPQTPQPQTPQAQTPQPQTAEQPTPSAPETPPPGQPRLDAAAASLLTWADAARHARTATEGEPRDLVLGSLAWARNWRTGIDREPDPAVADMLRSLRPDGETLEAVLTEAIATTDLSITSAHGTWTTAAPRFGQILRRAAVIAARTSGPEAPVQQRHLVAAALTGWRLPAPLVAVLGADNGDLCMRLCAAAVEHYPGETQEAWNDVLGLDDLVSPISSDYVPVRRPGDADPTLVDRLDVDAYVTLLATAITRRSTSMPLSVGLFGEWGSGKSYFMELLRQKVHQLSAGSLHGGPYLHDVVQITFNAWTYADTNLWASLAAEFFDQLGAPETDPDQERRAAIKSSLAEQNRLRAELVAVRNAASARTEAARAGYARAVTERERKSRTLNVELVKAVAGDEAVRIQLESLATELGFAKDDTTRTLQVAEDVQAIGDDLTATRRVLANRSLVVPFVVLLTAIALTALAVLLVPDDWAARAFGSGVAATAFTFLSGLGVVMAKSRRLVSQLRDVATRADAVRARVLEGGGQIAELATRLHEAEAAETVAQQRLSELDATIVQLDRQLEEMAPGRRLYEFIAERAASTEYRGQLGVVSSVRRDFQHLVKLMHDWQSERTTTGSYQPIERIVLYVDDLDRCEPEQVVQVLQAVHLLLAMDLFVVVVGVDPRWLLRALRRRYSGILDAGVVHTPDDRLRFEASTPQNYLEKIFQIPFVLPAMTATGFGTLIRSLAEPRSEAAAELQALRPSRPLTSESPPIDGGSAADLPPEPAPLRVEPESESAAAQAATDPSSSATVEEIVSTPVTERELRLLSRLSGMVGTPRAATRLFNVYGMLRSASDLNPGRQFLGGPRRPGDFQAVAQLLGMLSAEPELMPAILWGRPAEGETEPGGLYAPVPAQTWTSFVDGLAPQPAPTKNPAPATPTWCNAVASHIPADEVDAWRRLTRELTALRDLVTLDDLEPYRAWAEQIVRFSFLLSPFARDVR